MLARCWLVTFGLGALVAGCAFEQDEESTEPAPPAQCGDGLCTENESMALCPRDCLPGVAVQLDLDRCRAGLSAQQLAEEITLALTFVQRLAVLRTAWELGTRLSSDAVTAPMQLAYDPKSDAMSVPFIFDPQSGRYTRELPVQGSGALQVQYRFGETYQAGAAGDPIRSSLFSTESYLLGATVDIGSWKATVSYSAPGPLVELLGMGPTPPNPFTLGLFESGDEIEKQHQQWRLDVDEQLPGAIRVRLSAEVTADHLAIADDQVPITLKQASASDGTGRALQITDWELCFDEDLAFQMSLDAPLFGAIDFAVKGGALAHRGRWVSGSTATPELVLSCAE